MSLIKFFINEFNTLKKAEKIIFPAILFSIAIISIFLGDNILALISTICGVTYTFLAGKGKIYCYYIGLCGSLIYAYLSFVNGFYGQLLLYSLYFIPMEIIGIFAWKKHLKENSYEIFKTCSSTKNKIVYACLTGILTAIFAIVLKLLSDPNPILDSTTTIFSVLGQYLTLKRCIEQWYIWFSVNLLTLIMWTLAYLRGSATFAYIIMWAIYLFLSIYFLHNWKKELKK